MHKSKHSLFKEVLPRLLCNRFLKPTLSFWPYCTRQEKWKDWEPQICSFVKHDFSCGNAFLSFWMEASRYLCLKNHWCNNTITKRKMYLFAVAFPDYRSHLCFISANYSCATWAAMSHVLSGFKISTIPILVISVLTFMLSMQRGIQAQRPQPKFTQSGVWIIMKGQACLVNQRCEQDLYVVGWSPKAQSTAAETQAKTPVSSSVAVKRDTTCFFIALTDSLI